MTLDQAAVGSTVTVIDLQFDSELSKRITAMGVKRGARIFVVRRASFNGPLHIRIGTTDLAIRSNQAKNIKVL